MSITIEHVISMAIRDSTVLDQLGEALQNDLCIANPFYRRIVTFADTFMLEYRTLPNHGDWQMWLEQLEKGMIQDGTREALGRIQATDTSTFTPAFFAEQALGSLQQTAVMVARSRRNEKVSAAQQNGVPLRFCEPGQVSFVFFFQGLVHTKPMVLEGRNDCK